MGEPAQGRRVIDWHARFLQQAAWTRPLRDYLFARGGLGQARRVLEVGCGSGAILGEFAGRPPAIHGLDHDLARLRQARRYAAQAQLACAEALALPYPDGVFDLSFCHFFLLWAGKPLQALREMRRVTRPGGCVLALAEPDYLHRSDRPPALAPLGRLQNEALRRQGADPGLGVRLAALFRQAGLRIIESGPLQSAPDHVDAQMEWAVLESDLAGQIPREELERWKSLDERARAEGQRVLQVPTYFAFGRVESP